MNEQNLLNKCSNIEGLSFAQIAQSLNTMPSHTALMRKGWVGQALERLLGLKNNTLPGPDFKNLGIELKTLPLNQAHKPVESTFITGISLLNIHQETWQTSRCWSKLKKILWIPIEGDNNIPFLSRRVGKAILWSPSAKDTAVLQKDWTELTSYILLGRLDEIDAKFGEYLQIRPKAATGRSLTYAYDKHGQKNLTLPRGFYLRSSFTAKMYFEFLR